MREKEDGGCAYCRGPLKRALDLCLSLISLIALSPLLALLSTLVLVFMGRPIVFMQARVGMDGRLFRLLKFRTMRTWESEGPPITGSNDRRVTPLGGILRRSKLDELPQLFNVLKGDMSVVGPRPEIPQYVASYSPEQKKVLRVRPGLTDPATLLFRNEESLLGAVEEHRRESYYVGTILKEKLKLNLEYLERAGFWYDLVLMAKTVRAILRISDS